MWRNPAHLSLNAGSFQNHVFLNPRAELKTTLDKTMYTTPVGRSWPKMYIYLTSDWQTDKNGHLLSRS